MTAATIAVVASLETLLSVEASDKLDPYKRVTPTNREMKAQGLGNMVSGLIGGLPVTQVIVRTSANVQAGGRTKWAAVYHGVWLLVSVLAFPFVLNLIPLSALAAILLLVGYKLAKPATAIAAYKRGWSYFLPFAITVLGIVFVDLLVGIGLGLAVSTVTVLYQSWLTPYKVGDDGPGAPVRLVLAENVSFFNKAPLQHALESIPEGGAVVVDARGAAHIDLDVVEMLDDYHTTAAARGVEYSVLGDLGGASVPSPDVLKKTVERRVATSFRTRTTPSPLCLIPQHPDALFSYGSLAHDRPRNAHARRGAPNPPRRQRALRPRRDRGPRHRRGAQDHRAGAGPVRDVRELHRQPRAGRDGVRPLHRPRVLGARRRQRDRARRDRQPRVRDGRRGLAPGRHPRATRAAAPSRAPATASSWAT